MAIGATLRRAREQKGVSLEELARLTRVQPRLLDALEHEARTLLPPRPFLRGMVSAYAREVGLDPDVTVRDYLEELNPADTPPVVAPLPDPPRISLNHQSARTGWAALLIAAVGIVAAMIWNMPSGDAPAGPQPVGTSGAGEPVAATAPAATPGPPPPIITSSDGLAVVLEASGRSWVSASADGTRIVYRLLQPGDRESLRATDAIVLRVGDAGAITWTINGQARGPMGRRGDVRDVRLTPETATTIR